MKTLATRAEMIRRWRWLRYPAMLALMIFLTHHAIRWAMLPGYWMGSWLQSGDETAMEQARSRFGPVLLADYWIRDPDGTWGSKQEVLHQWGTYESAMRLRLIVWILSALICALLAYITRRGTQPTGRAYVSPAAGSPSADP